MERQRGERMKGSKALKSKNRVVANCWRLWRGRRGSGVRGGSVELMGANGLLLSPVNGRAFRIPPGSDRRDGSGRHTWDAPRHSAEPPSDWPLP